MELHINYVDGSSRLLRSAEFVLIHKKKGGSNLEDIISDLKMSGIKTADAISRNGLALIKIRNSSPTATEEEVYVNKKEVIREIRSNEPKGKKLWETIIKFC